MSQSPLLLQEYASAVLADRRRAATRAHLARLAQSAHPPRRARVAALLRAAADRLDAAPPPTSHRSRDRDRPALITSGAE